MQLRDFVTPTWGVIVLGLLIGAGFAANELVVGHSFVTNHALVWTLPLVTYVFLALMSTGVSIVVAYGILAGEDEILQQQRRLLILAIALLVGGFAALATELGSPLHMIWLLLSPNVASPIWWMGTLYSVELVLLFVKLVMDVKGWHGSADRPLAWATLIIASAAAMVLGSVFGTAIGRVDFRGLDASLLTLPVALASGSAAIVLLHPRESLCRVVHAMFRILAGAMALILFLQWLYELRASVAETIGWVQWWMVLPFLAAALFGGRVPRVMAALVILSSLWIELSFVITGQLATLGPMATWFGPVQSYLPNVPEIGIFVLGLAVAAAILKLGEQLLLRSPTAAAH
jgi:molybdopterin-containing oxidoreductase family membrane subunit